jgi:hypothetical protein
MALCAISGEMDSGKCVPTDMFSELLGEQMANPQEEGGGELWNNEGLR